MFYGKGLIIDKDKKRYKKYVSFLGIKIGEWKPFLNFTLVAITKVRGGVNFFSSRSMGNSVTVRCDLYAVYLCIDNKRKILVMKSENQEEALNLAKGASTYLNIDLISYLKKD